MTAQRQLNWQNGAVDVPNLSPPQGVTADDQRAEAPEEQSVA